MPRNNEPYTASFSISNEIALRLSKVTYELGRLSSFPPFRAGPEEYGQSAISLLSAMGITLRASQAKGLKMGSDIPSLPLAYQLYCLFKDAHKTNPYDKSILTKCENAFWRDGVPYRLSRRAEFFPYAIPMHARVEGLLDGVFAFANNGKEKIHPLILSTILLFEILALAPYREHNWIIAYYVAKVVLVNYDSIFACVPVERFIALRNQAIQNAYDEAVDKGDVAPFISQMLSIYEEALIHLRRYNARPVETTSRQVDKLLNAMEEGKFYSASEICTLLGLKSRLGIQLNYIRPALEAKKIVMSNPGAPTDRNQRYKKA